MFSICYEKEPESMNDPFYAEGLRFACTGCSKCCRHEPGYVFLSSKDIFRLMDATGLAFRDFLVKFTRTVDSGTGYAISLKETARFDCIFWKDGCTVYPARPLQCSTYPFWERIVETRASWLAEAEDCPGMNSGPLVSREKIDDLLARRRKDPPVLVPYGYTLETINENTILGSSRITADTTDASES
jgi:Fe-S-cluster containining protein